ncbi:MAG TPA: Hsp20/alpha crystallin family protein [Desulfobaccales bacterium]|nr:Hsp20/alpha crystallin family protein [Desulfobaccales bacterium]
MHRLIKIRIIRDFEHLEEQMRRGFDTLLEAYKTPVSFRPAADFYENAQGLVLRLELAGVAAADVSLTLTGHELRVRGRRRPPAPEGIRRFVHLEIAFGIFERRFTLPIAVDPQGVEARYVDGVLEVHLPRKAHQTRTIPVKADLSGE